MRPANSWNSCAPPKPLPCSPVTASTCLRRSTNELGGVLADSASRGYRLDAADRDRNSHRVLAYLLALALEISGRSRGRINARPAAEGARLLCPHSTRFADPARPLVGFDHRPQSSLHFRNASDRVFVA